MIDSAEAGPMGLMQGVILGGCSQTSTQNNRAPTLSSFYNRPGRKGLIGTESKQLNMQLKYIYGSYYCWCRSGKHRTTGLGIGAERIKTSPARGLNMDGLEVESIQGTTL